MEMFKKPTYADEPEYLSLLTAALAKPTDELARLVLADWVQERGDEGEAKAIRERRSFWVDTVPAINEAAKGVAETVQAAAVAMAQTLGPAMDGLRNSMTEFARRLQPALEQIAQTASKPNNTESGV